MKICADDGTGLSHNTTAIPRATPALLRDLDPMRSDGPIGEGLLRKKG